MLVLTRSVNEVIVINDDIRIVVAGISGTVVKLGIEAPKHVAVRRSELQERSARPTRFLGR